MLEEEIGIEGGVYVTRQMTMVENEIVKMVAKRQTQEERGERKLRQMTKKSGWAGLTVKRNMTAYFGAGGGYAARHSEEEEEEGEKHDT